MRISVSVTNYSWPGGPTRSAAALARVVAAAEDAGIDTVWVADHLLQADPTAGPGETEMYEAYTVLGYLAGRTSRVRLGAMVSPASLRPPALLVKAVTTLDALSGGRAWLGLGAGYHGAEAEALGLPLPPTAERFDRLEETLQIALRMWTGDETPFHGRYHQLARPVDSPGPVQRPHPPILIGGTGERRTLRLVARYADAAVPTPKRSASGTSSCCIPARGLRRRSGISVHSGRLSANDGVAGRYAVDENLAPWASAWSPVPPPPLSRPRWSSPPLQRWRTQRRST
jgi:F420-dependent oxidoreductase-like protein